MSTNHDVLDLFASQALRAILSNQDMMAAVTKMGTQAIMYDEAIKKVAERSFAVAAAMIVERAERRKALPEMTFGGGQRKIK